MGLLLSYSTWGMPEVPIDVAVKHCAGLGFDGLELTVCPGWTTEGTSLTSDQRREIRRLYTEHNLDLGGLCANTPLLEDDPAAHAASIDRFHAYLDLAAELQLPDERLSVSTTAGGAVADWERVKQRLVDQFGALAEYAENVGVVVSMEPHVSTAIHHPDQVLWLLEQVDSPAIGIHFDISHFNVQGMAMESVIEQLAPHSAHTHVKDERGLAPKHEFLIPGEGEMDYVRYLKAMEEAGYEGHIVVEISLMVQRRTDYDPFDAASQSYRVLARAFDDAGIARGDGSRSA
jgi:sugar phosphate isomerase/epimerase